MSNSFTPRKKIFKEPEIKQEEYFIEYEKIEKAIPIDDNGNFKIEKSFIPKKTKIIDYVNSFADECSIENILKKYYSTGDENILGNPTKKLTNNQETINDTTIYPEDSASALDLMNKIGNEAKDKLNGQSLSDFIENNSLEDLIKLWTTKKETITETPKATETEEIK